MLNKMKLLLNTLSAILFILIITTNKACAAASETWIQSSGMSGQIIMMAVCFGAMYFLLIKPQSKKAKEHKELIYGLNNEDEVITSGGLLGRVSRVIDNFVILTIADGVEVVVQKQAVAQRLQKGTIKSL